jgi:hypothetical protein
MVRLLVGKLQKDCSYDILSPDSYCNCRFVPCFLVD